MRAIVTLPMAVLALAACTGATQPRPAAPSTAESTPSAPATTAARFSPISLDGFRDSANHYRNRVAGADYPRHDPSDIVAIADNILLQQRDSGGWPPNWDPQRVLDASEKQRIEGERAHPDSSFDNHSTYTHVQYLAAVYAQTREPRHRDACLRGIDFLLAAQDQSGGFPHSYPGFLDYHSHITFMDDVTPGALEVLRQAARQGSPFEFIDGDRLGRLRAAVERGNAALLKLQIVIDGQPTVWAGQYDRTTLEPATARSYELPALVSRESVSVVRYLMRERQPSPAVTLAIEGAVRWFQRSQLQGIRVEEFPAEPVRYEFHTSTTDRRVVADASAPPLWARFYEIDTNRPFLANRDGCKVYALGDVERERRTGYSWYGYYAAALLERVYPAWQTAQRR